jgi:SNF2-related domain
MTTPSSPFNWVNLTPELVQTSLDCLVPLGCLTSRRALNDALSPDEARDGWGEVLQFNLHPGGISQFDAAPQLLDKAVQRLLKAAWIKILAKALDGVLIYRIYLLPNDVARSTVARGSRSLRADLEELLPNVNISPEVWNGSSTSQFVHFDPWAQAEAGSLFYIFNTLPSPNPQPNDILDRHSRLIVSELLDYDRQIPGLLTALYPYQARSAAAMIQRESSTELQLDPRFETRIGPDGSLYYYVPKDLAFYRQPQLFDSHCGGVLAETMGLGKTIICLAVVLATKNHLPKIPPQYQERAPAESVPTLYDMCLSVAGRHSLPVKAHFRRIERHTGDDLRVCINSVDDKEIDYFIPQPPPRSNRTGRTVPPKRMILCSGTIIVVPRNIVSQKLFRKFRINSFRFINGSQSYESTLPVVLMD